MTFIRTSFSRVTYDTVRTINVDNPLGDLVFKRAGAEVGRFFSTFFRPIGHLRITTDQEVQDASGGAILAGDNSGVIDQLGQIGVAVTTGTSSFKVTARPAAIASEGQSGTLTEANGKWVAAAGDYLYLWLDSLIPQLALLAGVKIVSLEVVYDTGHNDDYITQVILGHYKNTQPNEANFSSDWSDTTDKGNGDTTAATASYTPNLTLTVERSYQLQIEAVVPQTSVTVFAINIEYELV